MHHQRQEEHHKEEVNQEVQEWQQMAKKERVNHEFVSREEVNHEVQEWQQMSQKEKHYSESAETTTLNMVRY